MTDIKYSPGSVESRLLAMAGGIRKPEQSEDGYIAVAVHNAALGTNNLTYKTPSEIGLSSEFGGNAFTNWINVNLTSDPTNNLRYSIPADGNMYHVESLFIIRSATKALVYRIDTLLSPDPGTVVATKYVNNYTYAGLPVSGFPTVGSMSVSEGKRVLTYGYSVNVGEVISKKFVHYRYAII